MKLCLAFMFQQELPWLNLHLPVLLKSAAIDGIVAIDGGSTDGGAEYIRGLGGIVEQRTWDWKPLDQENAVIDLAERSGFDLVLLTAPDELWYPRHIDEMKDMMSKRHKALSFPTFNFVRNRRHWAAKRPYYPDMHIRVWRLNEGIRHAGILDSVANVDYSKVTRCMTMPMFHYSHIKPREWYTLKGLNFHRVRDGLPPLDVLPEGMKVEPYPEHVEFFGDQPLDPNECGENAPYG
jgi:hypothetical protein